MATKYNGQCSFDQIAMHVLCDRIHLDVPLPFPAESQQQSRLTQTCPGFDGSSLSKTVVLGFRRCRRTAE